MIIYIYVYPNVQCFKVRLIQPKQNKNTYIFPIFIDFEDVVQKHHIRNVYRLISSWIRAHITKAVLTQVLLPVPN